MITEDGERIPPIPGDIPCDDYDPAGPGAGVELDGFPQCAAHAVFKSFCSEIKGGALDMNATLHPQLADSLGDREPNNFLAAVHARRDQREIRFFRVGVVVAKDFGISVANQNAAVRVTLPLRNLLNINARVVKPLNAHRAKIALREPIEAARRRLGEPATSAGKGLARVVDLENAALGLRIFPRVDQLRDERREPSINGNLEIFAGLLALKLDTVVIHFAQPQRRGFGLPDAREPEKCEEVGALFAQVVIALRARALNDRVELRERRNPAHGLSALPRLNQFFLKRIGRFINNAIGNRKLEKTAQEKTHGIVVTGRPLRLVALLNQPGGELARPNLADRNAHAELEGIAKTLLDRNVVSVCARRLAFSDGHKTSQVRIKFSVRGRGVARVEFTEPRFQLAIGKLAIARIERVQLFLSVNFFDSVVTAALFISVKIFGNSFYPREKGCFHRGYLTGLPRSFASIFFNILFRAIFPIEKGKLRGQDLNLRPSGYESVLTCFAAHEGTRCFCRFFIGKTARYRPVSSGRKRTRKDPFSNTGVTLGVTPAAALL
jgi:hypothetical protein